MLPSQKYEESHADLCLQSGSAQQHSTPSLHVSFLRQRLSLGYTGYTGEERLGATAPEPLAALGVRVQSKLCY